MYSINLLAQGEVLFVPDYKPFGIPAEKGISSYDLFDFNNDGHLDVVASIIDDGISKIVWALGPDLSNLISSSDYTKSLSPKVFPFYITLSDIDQDGDQDLYIGEHSEYQIDANVYILENISSGNNLSFSLRTGLTIDASYILAMPSAVDFNNDNFEDLFLADFKGNVTIYQNNGNYSFSKIGTNIMGLSDFNTHCSFDELSDGNNLICYDKENDFNILLKNGNTYTRDTVNSILGNPDKVYGKFFQPRIRDFNNDGKHDAFLSVNTFSMNSGFYSDTWLYNGFCVDTLYKPEIPIISSLYAAESNITSTGEIRSPSAVTYKAGESVLLDTTFNITLGVIFEALIEDCNDD